MKTKNFEPSFQMITNSLSEININNTIINISDSDDLSRQFSIDIKELSIEPDEEVKLANLAVEIRVLIEENNSDSPKKFDAKIVINGVFTDNINVSEDDFTDKLKINGVAALYSIARGCITNISAQTLASGKIVLPLVNFIEAAKSISE